MLKEKLVLQLYSLVSKTLCIIENVMIYFVLAGLAAGTTEAVLVVSPMDLIKIRLQVIMIFSHP